MKPSKENGLLCSMSANVADNLSYTTHQHARHEAPAAPSPAQVGMHNSKNAIGGRKEDVGCQRRPVAVEAPFDGTCVDAARGIRAKDDDSFWNSSIRHVVSEDLSQLTPRKVKYIYIEYRGLK